MITLQKFKWGYAFSYGDDNEIDFEENVVTQILGQNGFGKSSIPLALEEVIFNKNSKGIKKGDIPNRYAGKGYWLDLTFKDEQNSYQIKVDRKTATVKVKFFKNGEDISSHTATNTFKQIEEVMGMDFKMFSQLVYQNTNTSLGFLVATDTNRKKFLIDLLKLDDYVRMFELFKEAVKEHATIVTKIQGQVETVENWLKQNSLEDTSIKPLLDAEEYDTSSEERAIAELSFQISNIDKNNRQIANNNSYRALLDAINIEEIQAIDAEHKSYDDEQAELGGLVSDKTRRQAYIKKIKGLGDTCPTCEQPVEADFKSTLIRNEEIELVKIEERISAINSIIDAIKSNNSRYKHKQEKIKEWEELFHSVNKSLPTETINKQDLVDELTNLTLKVSNAKEKLKAIIAHNQAVTHHNSRVAVFQEQSEKFLTDLNQYSKQLEKEERNLNNLEVLKKSFSTNGLIAYKIENLVKTLEEQTNEYLADLSDGRFTIEFTVSSDKLNVIITDNGNAVDILALSSGELARVNTATLLALRELMNSISKSRINVLFLDEVISVLDEAGREKLVEVLLKEDKLNTYIVSHSWSHPLLAKLEVVKDDNMSRLEHD